MNKSLELEIMNGECGQAAKFILNFTKEKKRLNENIKSSYANIEKQFFDLYREYRNQIINCSSTSRSSSVSTAASVKSNEASKIVDETLNDKRSSLSSSSTTNQKLITNKKLRSKQTDPEELLAQKFRTPLHRGNNIAPIFPNEQTEVDKQDSISKSRKRKSAHELSLIDDEDKISTHNDSIDEIQIKKNLFKGTVIDDEAKKKKNNVMCMPSSSNQAKEEQEEATSSNPSKKQKCDVETKSKQKKKDLTESNDEEATTTTKPKKTSKKKKADSKSSRANSIIDNVDNEIEKPELTKKTKKKAAKQQEKTIIAEQENKQTINHPKTPSAFEYYKNQPKTPLLNRTRVDLMQSTIKRTIKRPLTRRAVAAAAAAAAAAGVLVPPSSIKKKLLNSGKKELKLPMQQNQNTIDARKQRHSQAKLEAKRKSIKKAQAFFKNAALSKSKLVMNSAKKNNNSDEPEQDKEKLCEKKTIEIQAKTRDSNRLTITVDKPKDEEIVKKFLNSGSPQLVVHRLPTNILIPSTISKSTQAAKKDNHTKPPLSYATSRITPCKTNSTFQRFLERNTPVKFTKNETEEKRKAELLAKEVKEKERLAELEKQKQEQRDEKKKIRDERQRKINEQKQKQLEVIEEKKKKQNNEYIKSNSANSSMNTQSITTATYKTLNTMPTSSSSTSILSSLASASTSSSSTVKSFFQSNRTSASNLNQMLLPKVILNNINNVPTNSKLSFSSNPITVSNFNNELNNFKQLSNPLIDDDDDNNQTVSSYKPTSSGQNILSQIDNQPLKQQQKNLETTYVLPLVKEPGFYKPDGIKPVFSNYEVTPLQPLKLKNIDNYDVSDLRSEDETDDEEEPSKPLPEWAKDPMLEAKVKSQNNKMVNFTKLFKAASQSDINLEKIFRTRRKKFTERSSSANWNSPPVWRTNGINGEESFRHFRKNY